MAEYSIADYFIVAGKVLILAENSYSAIGGGPITEFMVISDDLIRKMVRRCYMYLKMVIIINFLHKISIIEL